MNEPVDGKRLLRSFNHYTEYRKAVERTGASFTEELAKSTKKLEKKIDRQSLDSKSNSDRNRRVLRGGRRYSRPCLGKAKNISDIQARRLARYAPIIEEAASKHNVPVELICGVILQESGGKSNAVSHAGACGLMQLMPQTARRFGVENSFDPKQNIDGGTRYLRWLLDRFNGDIELALAGYNAGEHNVEKHGNKIPPFKETRQYIPNVLGYTQTMVDIFLAKANQHIISLDTRKA